MYGPESMGPSARLGDVARSSARQIMDLASQMPGVIHLEIGEPDFTAATHVTEAATAALQGGRTQYPPTAGLRELRDAAAAKLARVNGIRAAGEQVVVTNGGGQGLFAVMATLLDPGDVVALPNPGWPNYRSMAAILGIEVATYALTSSNGYSPDLDEVDALLSGRCRAIVLNHPSNPLGTVFSDETVEALVELAAKHGAWIISDECYDEIYFGRRPLSPAAIDPGAPVVSVFSMSKTHAMTGWRVGYVTAPPEIAPSLAKVQEPLVLGTNAPGQHGAIAALTGPRSHLRHMVEQYRIRRDAALERLGRSRRDVLRPDGAFYLWLDIAATGLDDGSFALRLLDEEQVAVAAGSSFGTAGAGFVRLSLGTSLAELTEAIARIDRFIDRRA